MWRYDAGRTASSPDELPDHLHLLWRRALPKPERAWEDSLNRDLMQYDRTYEPVVMGKSLFFGSSHGNALVALDTESGRERWVHQVDGPVRLAPVVTDGRVLFVSDDGQLYCLDAETGRRLWAFRGGPTTRHILGNGRLVSTWPARGGPVVKDGTVYFAAGIWPFMGTFIHALDAATGRAVWTNDGTGSLYMLQPHNSPAYAGVGPQGAMAAVGSKLLIPGGRSVPACYDRKTGAYLYYHLSRYNKTGGDFVAASDSLMFSYHRDGITSLYRLADGERLIRSIGGRPVISPTHYYLQGDSTTALPGDSIRAVIYLRDILDRKTGQISQVEATRWVADTAWRIGVDSRHDMIQAGNRLYAAGAGWVTSVDLQEPGPPSVAWRKPIAGTPSRLLAADNKLFVVTLEGEIMAFGGRRPKPLRKGALALAEAAERAVHAAGESLYKLALPLSRDGRLANHIIETTGQDEGYCVVYGAGRSRLPEALVARSNLRVIAVVPDAGRVRAIRSRLRSRGVSAGRLTVFQGGPSDFDSPDYLAALTVVEDDAPLSASSLSRIYDSTRPYGGVVYASTNSRARRKSVLDLLDSCGLENAQTGQVDDAVLVYRHGKLPGAADWTHQYGDVANTIKSDDQRVKLPLGLLWFGGTSNDDVLPRHGHGPPEQILGGRLFIQGIDSFSARDVYTGRLLWKRDIPDIGTFGVYWDETYRYTPLSTSYNQVHIPGANSRGTNFVVTADRIYIAQADDCLVLDPETGNLLGRIPLPRASEEDAPRWGYIGVSGRFLIAGSGMVDYKSHLVTQGGKRARFYDLDIASSRHLIVMDRYTGELLWHTRSELGFRHNAIVAGGGRVFCIDTLPDPVKEALDRRGISPAGRPSLQAFDIETGRVLWRTTDGIFGTWLGYSDDHDVLLQAGRPSRDMVVGESGRGMTVYNAATGEALWSREVSYAGPCILHGDAIITDRYAYNLFTGQRLTRTDPLTGNEVPWAYSRRYGCNYAIASEHMLTFRSAAAGYYDLARDGGTGNFGGFKSGCTSNLIVADGVLNAPDYTRTCVCSYQNQTSLAMVHDPDVETWVTYFREPDEGPIRQVGINLGAPGNRRGPDGRFWIAHPLLPLVSNPQAESGLSVDVSVRHGPGGFYTRHTSRITGDLDWVGASGCRGIQRLELDLGTRRTAQCEVRLIFAEPDHDAAGQRVFNVSIEGLERLSAYDIAQQAGGRWRTVEARIEQVNVTDGRLTIAFTPDGDSTASPALLPLLCGMSVTATYE